VPQYIHHSASHGDASVSSGTDSSAPTESKIPQEEIARVRLMPSTIVTICAALEETVTSTKSQFSVFVVTVSPSKTAAHSPKLAELTESNVSGAFVFSS